MSSLLEDLGVEVPIVQAGMGGGVSTSALAAAVSEAGGLGTLGTLAPTRMRAELQAARERTARPVAVNLLLPFARRAHWEAAAGADLIVTFWGRPQRRGTGTWLHQCGSVAEAEAARAAGADGVIVQGVEAGGHVRGSEPALDLLARVRARVGPDYGVLVAGGIADASDVRTALDAGADAAVLGTRFLLSEEAGAHPGYKQRVLAARGTLLTELFGMGWAAPHRVVANEATERWLSRDGRAPSWVRRVNALTEPLLRRVPLGLGERMTATQRPGIPLLAPNPVTETMDPRLLECTPLYAGETALRIDAVRPAGALVRELAGP